MSSLPTKTGVWQSTVKLSYVLSLQWNSFTFLNVTDDKTTTEAIVVHVCVPKVFLLGLCAVWDIQI